MTSSRILNGLNIRSWVCSNQMLKMQISRRKVGCVSERLYCTWALVFLSFRRIHAVSTSSFIPCFLGVNFLLRSMSSSFRGSFPRPEGIWTANYFNPKLRQWPGFTKFAISCSALLPHVLYWYVLTTCVDVSMTVLTLFLRHAGRFQATLPFRK